MGCATEAVDRARHRALAWSALGLLTSWLTVNAVG
jgi:hypothetical protein